MSNIDKQWLQQKIAGMEAASDDIPFGLGEDGTNTLAALRIALESLEAEPAGWQVKKYGGNWVSIKKEDVDHYRFNEEIPVREVYTAPPAPVSVPDAMEMDDDFDSAFEHGKAVGWNACRAAMLHGAEPVQANTLPDDTRRLDWLDDQNKRLNDYFGTTYGWKFDANFQRNAMMLNDSNYPVMTVRQAIDEAMAAAPQQEVK